MERQIKIQQINYIRLHCDDFLDKVYEYMHRENWCWHGESSPPNAAVIRHLFFELLNNMCKGETTCIGSGGFKIEVNEETDLIECMFGSSDKGGFITYIPQPSGYSDRARIRDFIEFICSKNPALDPHWLDDQILLWEQAYEG